MSQGGYQTALITGATSGIGLELARLAARDGYRVLIVARHEDALRRTAEELQRAGAAAVILIPLDLSEPASVGALVERLTAERLTPDVLINNAGFGAVGAVADLDPDLLHRMIELNITALTRLTRALLPGMLARGTGRVLNVASTAAFQPGPFMAVYYASKAFVLSFSEALAEELRGSGVTVTALCPGPTRTEFAERSGARSTPLFRSGVVMEAAPVARAGYEGMMKGRRVVITGGLNRLLAFGTRLVPRRLATRISRATITARLG